MSAEILLAVALGVLAIGLVAFVIPWIERRRITRELRGYRARLRAPQTRESLGRSQRVRVGRST